MAPSYMANLRQKDSYTMITPNVAELEHVLDMQDFHEEHLPTTCSLNNISTPHRFVIRIDIYPHRLCLTVWGTILRCEGDVETWTSNPPLLAFRFLDI